LKKVKTIESLSKIADKYEVFIIDQWGVMHNGQAGFPYAIKCIKNLVKLKKKLIIISNSSRRKNSTIDRLPKLGFDKNNFIEIMTSGELVWNNLYTKSQYFFKNLGHKCYHLTDKTKKDNVEYVDGLGYDIVDKIEDADFILGCVTSSGLTAFDYVPLLQKAIKKKIPFLCANPDFETLDFESNNLIICMGTIAELYQDFGGYIFIMGKPSTHIYQEATKKIHGIDKKKIIAIGDSLHHDIKGANSFNIDSLLITSGIHKSSFDKLNPKWDNNNNDLSKFKIKPTYLCSKFQF
jgi:HAD superfamily hydrolase (TIGR01459 family)